MRTRIYSAEFEKKQSVAFANAVFQAQEEERGRITNELHDTVAQDIRALRLKIKNGEHDTALSLSGECIEKLRSICYNLMPPDLKLVPKQIKIEQVISFLCADFEKHSGIPCTFTAQEHLNQLSEPKKILNFFRIIQESLTNIEKHAQASECSVMLKNGTAQTEKTGGFTQKTLVAYITDDGIGFDTGDFYAKSYQAEKPLHFGLQSMKSRADVICAHLEITSSRDEGTEVRIEVGV